MKMAKRMDAGPVLAIEKVKIESQDNSTSVFEKMGLAASKLILDNFELICSDQAHYVEQDEDKVVFAPVITKQEEKIDFSKDEMCIRDRVLVVVLGGIFGYGYINLQPVGAVSYTHLDQSITCLNPGQKLFTAS